MSKRALGRGLGALIPGADDSPPSEVPLDHITPNPHQPRRTFDQQALEELAKSISQHGLLQPIVLRPHFGQYQLVAGERRFRAAKIAGLTTIPAVIMDLTDRQLAEISLVENLQREDLNPLEEANAYSQLLKEFNLTQEVLANRIGKSRSAIANTLRLLNLASPVQAMVADGRISPGHARTLLSLEAEEQLTAAEKIVNQGMTVRAAEKTKKAKSKPRSNPLSPNTTHMQQELMEHLGTKVILEEKGDSGRIIIEFYSSQDANRIIDKILQ